MRARVLRSRWAEGHRRHCGGTRGQRPALAIVVTKTPSAVPHRVLPAEMASDHHAQTGATATTGVFGHLQGDLLERDNIVLADGALRFLAEDAVEGDVVERHEGAGGGRRAGRDAGGVVGG